MNVLLIINEIIKTIMSKQTKCKNILNSGTTAASSTTMKKLIFAFSQISLEFAYIFRVACRCLWDSDTDNYAQDVFMNVSSVLAWMDTYFSHSNKTVLSLARK